MTSPAGTADVFDRPGGTQIFHTIPGVETPGYYRFVSPRRGNAGLLMEDCFRAAQPDSITNSAETPPAVHKSDSDGIVRCSSGAVGSSLRIATSFLHTVKHSLRAVTSCSHTVTATLHTVTPSSHTVTSLLHAWKSFSHTVTSCLHTVTPLLHTWESFLHTETLFQHTVTATLHTESSRHGT